jgi:hypothetical protein
MQEVRAAQHTTCNREISVTLLKYQYNQGKFMDLAFLIAVLTKIIFVTYLTF